MKTHILLPAIITVLSSTLICLKAETLLFDFGQIDTDEPTLSPGHVHETIGTTWNSIENDDVSSGLLTDSGSAATGIGIDLGTSGGDTYNVNFSTNPNADYLAGTSLKTGVYINNAPGKDGIFQNTAFDTVGVQITGLAAGEYNIYLTGRNSNLSNDSAAFFVDQGTAASSFNFGTPSLITMANTAGTRTSWVNGDNYGVATITLTSGNALYIGLDGAGGADDRPFLNSIEVVAVPEPSSVLLMLLGAAGVIAIRSVKRRK